jgi:hypothetical protein
MTALYGLFAEPESVQRAVDDLRRAGVADRDITVLSAEPFEEFEFSHRDKATWMFWIAGLGGLVGLSFGAWLTTMSERAWPLVTGGMPIVAMWPNLVVTFELTMLSAILATVLTLLITAGLPTRRAMFADPAVAEGAILLGVAPSFGAAGDDTVRQTLTSAGALAVKTAQISQ